MQVKFSALGPEQKGVRLARQHGRRKHKLSLLNLAAVSSASSCPVWCPVPQLALICAERGGTHSLLKWLSHEQKCLYKVSPIYPFHGCVKQTGMFMEHWVTRGAVLPKADHPTLKEAIYILSHHDADRHTHHFHWLETQSISLLSLVVFRWNKNQRKSQWNN